MCMDINASGIMSITNYIFFLSQIKLTNVSMALQETFCVEAMQEEQQKFIRLGVWDLIDKPNQVKSLS